MRKVQLKHPSLHTYLYKGENFMICQICNEEYKETKSGAGKFYMHLNKVHSISKKDYVTQHELNGNPRMCGCGCGEESYWTNRRGYSKYAKGHNKFKHREKIYAEKNGQPVCSDSDCSKLVIFYRGKPRAYCSPECVGKNVGWLLEKTQASVKSTLLDRYGVTNAF